MSEELDYVKARLDDLLQSQLRLEDKIDRMRDEQVAQREQISSNRDTVADHDRLLLMGNGQKPVMIQLAEANTRLSDVETSVQRLEYGNRHSTDPVDLRKEKIINRGKVIGMVGLVISQFLTWVFAFPWR
jgi:hypothetical protein